MTITETSIAHLAPPDRIDGCDVYDVIRLEGADSHLQFVVVTDRATDLGKDVTRGIPGKGLVHANLAAFWFERFAPLARVALVALLTEREKLRDIFAIRDAITLVPRALASRTLVMQKLKLTDLDCSVVGYITEKAWPEYARHGTIGGQSAPAGLRPGDRLPDPLVIPVTATSTELLAPERRANDTDEGYARLIVETSNAIYREAGEYARDHGLLLASATLRYGLVGLPLGEGAQGVRMERLVLAGLPVTPDFAEFWDVDQYRPGVVPPDYVSEPIQRWRKEAHGTVGAPLTVIEQATCRYLDLFSRLTGKNLAIV